MAFTATRGAGTQPCFGQAAGVDPVARTVVFFGAEPEVFQCQRTEASRQARHRFEALLEVFTEREGF